MPTIAETLAQANAYHRAGNLSDAAASLEQAVRLQPDQAEIHDQLGIVLAQQGKLEAAAACYRKALELQPSFVPAHGNLGNLLRSQGKLDDAASCYRRILQLADSSQAHYDLGQIAQAQGRFAEAAACYRRAIELQGDFSEAHANLGTVLAQQGKLAEAVASYRRALAIRDDSEEVHSNLGAALAGQGMLAEAVASCRRAVELKSDYTAAYYNLAIALKQQGNLDEAAASYRKALELQPDYAEAYNNLAVVLGDQNKPDEAAACCRRALELKPDFADAHHTMGILSAKQEKFDEAAACYRKALGLQPDHPDALANYGVCMQSQGRLDEAIESFRAAIRLNDQNPNYHGNLVYALNYHPDYDSQAVLAEHRAWARRHADPLSSGVAPHANNRTPGRRLRVGYVSSQFRSHAVNFFSEPILAAHDHRAVEVFCYSAALPAESDATTARLRGHADHWREIAGRGDQQVSEMIRDDQIDVLVDLCGHIGGNRLLVFARKPAPVQVTYIGYQNTTGMLAMDYRLTDDWSDPPGTTDHLYTEKLVRLPRAFFCYLPSADAPDETPLPAMANKIITFGSFNHFGKVTPQVLATWAEILSVVPQSRLVLLAPVTPSLRRQVGLAFERHGVSAERVELASRRPRGEYLKLIGRVDIALDPFPFNGHTTTCDCLWQGVPVVTLAGETYVSRYGGSALLNLGMQDLIASTREQYVAIARGLATDVERLQGLRAGLRARMLASPLVDAAGFTRNLEAAYRRMWVDWCAKQSAK